MHTGVQEENRGKLLVSAKGRNKKNGEAVKVEVTGRVCAQCDEYRLKDNFWKSKHTKDGLYSSCIECKKKLESTEHRQAVRKKRIKKIGIVFLKIRKGLEKSVMNGIRKEETPSQRINFAAM